MKETFVFVGSSVSDMMGVVSFRSFGQAKELTREQARDLASGGSAIVPRAQFDALGFTAEELRKFGPFGAHANAPAEFAAKQQAAIAAHDAFRLELESEKEEAV